jgi:hypothetical protein
MAKRANHQYGIIGWLRRKRRWLLALFVGTAVMDLWYFHIRPSCQSLWFAGAGFFVAIAAAGIVLILMTDRKH